MALQCLDVHGAQTLQTDRVNIMAIAAVIVTAWQSGLLQVAVVAPKFAALAHSFR